MPIPVAACWTHLTDPEREQCKAARARRREEGRQRYQQMLAERAARGEPEPQQVYQAWRPCTPGQCITRAKLSRGSDDSDTAVTACARCDETVCILCRDSNHRLGTPCTSLSAVTDHELPPTAGEGIDHGPNPRQYLNHLVAQLARVTGEQHATVNSRINRVIGVSSRIGAEEALIRRAAAVARDWLAAEEKVNPVETGRDT
jgi:hypothetical protein